MDPLRAVTLVTELAELDPHEFTPERGRQELWNFIEWARDIEEGV